MLDTTRDRLVFFENSVHNLGIVTPLAAFDYGSPLGARQLYLVIPLVIVKGLGHRLHTFRLIVTNAVILVGKQFGRQYPDFLRAAVLELGIDLVDHLHDVNIFAKGRLAPRQGLRIAIAGIVFIKVPQVTVIVTIRYR